MNNFNALVLGMVGSGKSNFVKHALLPVTPRAIVFDRMAEYEDGAIFTDFEEATEFWLNHIEDDWHIILRSDNPDEFRAWFDIIFQAQTELDLPPVGLFIEESSLYSTSHDIDLILDRLYTKGRHGRISIVTIAQQITQINPIIRDQSHIWISFRLRRTPKDVSDRFTRTDIEQLGDLETYIPGSPPVCGRHYLTDRGCEAGDPVVMWADALRG